MSDFTITGRCLAAPPAAGWRDELAAMLGERPRRIGIWAELGLYGALRCMADAGEAALPPDALLVLASRRGTHVPTATALEQMKDGLPMPLTFLQTQPSQVLAMLAAWLGWRGRACFIADTGMLAALRLGLVQAGSGGLLFGWVEEEAPCSLWLRVCAENVSAGTFHPFEETPANLAAIRHLSIAGNGLEAR